MIWIRKPRGDAAIAAEMIANSLERFGSARFKGVGHKAMGEVMDSGALGVEILISGKIPSSRAKTWRFYQGYLKKCGDISVSGVDKSIQAAKLKSGVVGVQVSIMPSTTILPDKVEVRSTESEPETQAQSQDEKLDSAEKSGKQEREAEHKKEDAKKKTPRKTPAKKKTEKSDKTEKTSKSKDEDNESKEE